MMVRKILITCLGIAALSVVAIGEASADSRFSRPEIRRDLYEHQRSRQQLRRDIRPAPPRPTYVPRYSYRDYYRDHRGVGWYRHPNGRWYRYPPRYGWWR